MKIKRLIPALILAGLMLTLAFAMNLAEGAGLVSEDMGRRVVQVAIGLLLAAYANLMPKRLGRWRSAEAEAREQKALRLGGWSLTLAGLAHAALWAFAPLAFADTASMVVVAGALLLAFGYTVLTLARCRSADAGSTSS
tara:strand:+ start:462 stop:878 length:417 start_codon:yes stop_codon:yes gene_type:complete